MKKPSPTTFLKSLGLYVPKDKAKQIRDAIKKVEQNEALPKKLRASKSTLKSEYYYVKKYASDAPAKKEIYQDLSASEQKQFSKIWADYPDVKQLSDYHMTKLFNSLKTIDEHKRKKQYKNVERLIVELNLKRAGLLSTNKALPKPKGKRFYEYVGGGGLYFNKTESDFLKNTLNKWSDDASAYASLYGSDML